MLSPLPFHEYRQAKSRYEPETTSTNQTTIDLIDKYKNETLTVA